MAHTGAEVVVTSLGAEVGFMHVPRGWESHLSRQPKHNCLALHVLESISGVILLKRVQLRGPWLRGCAQISHFLLVFEEAVLIAPVDVLAIDGAWF